MAFFVQLLANYAGLIYLACVVGVFVYFREILAAQQASRNALYSLEREAAGARTGRAVLMIAVFLAIGGGTYLVKTQIAPNLPAGEPNETPTPSFLLPTESPTPTFQPSPTRTPRPTATPTGQAPPTEAAPALQAATPAPTPPALPAAVCPDPNVQLVAPVAGQTFTGTIQLRGTADAQNFAFYKFTLTGPGTGNVEQTAGDVVREPRRDTVLGEINPAGLMAQPGVYIVALVVVDNTGNELPHCTVPVIIQPAQ
jgi:hypothetical protein